MKRAMAWWLHGYDEGGRVDGLRGGRRVDSRIDGFGSSRSAGIFWDQAPRQRPQEVFSE